MASIGKGLESYLHRQAREIALNHLAEAREQAARIREQTETELLQAHKIYEQQSVRSNDQERRRSLAKARLAASHQLALNNDLALRQVWQSTEAALRSITRADVVTRRAVMRDLIVDAAIQLDGGALEIQVCEDDLALFTPDFVDKLTDQVHQVCKIESLQLSPQTGDIWGGVVVSRTDVGGLVDNSFETRLALVQEEMRNLVFQILDTDPLLVK